VLHETDFLFKNFANKFKPFTFVETSYRKFFCMKGIIKPELTNFLDQG